ncbi:MAG: hypothetical protein GXY76_19195 [Chloroflexi bacterium]|nr:hypothetical protein [Chloroflexota bacterium]
MAKLAAFLRPTWTKAVFLVQWVFFILLTAIQGDLGTPGQWVAILWPLAFFYLAACGLVAWSQRTTQVARGWRLVALAAALAALDQGVKAALARWLPVGREIPLLPGLLHLSPTPNMHGTWLAGLLDLPFQTNLVLMVLVIPVLLGSHHYHRRYVETEKPSLWVDIAYIGLAAGIASWLFEIATRGYILDYIGLPGVVAADLKDLCLAFGAASAVAETLGRPDTAQPPADGGKDG